MLQLQLTEKTIVHAPQLLHFPQPPIAVDQDASEMQCDSEFGSGALMFSPDVTDTQFNGSAHNNQPACSISELGSIVHLSHACGNSFLVHFGCAANVQVFVELEGKSEIVQKCFLAMHSVLLPGQLRSLLQSYHRCHS
jgi:hypothetical protein